ncbi:MAG: helix-turn-helix domain-containing protein [Myxococcota bacterium]|nr:helix-turn-helix domain-containing protein [Myxococcota bacterium]
MRPVRSAQPPLLPDPSPPVPAELHFGILLRRARERKGLSQQDVVHATRIAERWIPALEEARLDLLPAPVYVTGYVRSYARLVGLDGDEVVRRYQALTQQRAEQAALAAAARVGPTTPRRWTPRHAVVAGCCAAALALVLLLIALLWSG